MADQQASSMVLIWQRHATGRLMITVAVTVTLPDVPGQDPNAPPTVMNAPVHAFLLTKEEENNLRAVMGGIVLATNVPELVH